MRSSGKELKKTRTIEPIVRERLCVRCGGCFAACPVDGTISLDSSLFPVIDDKTCTDCGICVKVCPAGDVDLKGLYEGVFGQGVEPKSHGVGPLLRAYVAHSSSGEIRSNASSGGFVTQLLAHLLESGKADAVVVVTNHDEPMNPVAVLTSSLKDVLQGKGSKYMVVPVNSALKGVAKIKGKVVFVGLPCNLQSLRMWEAINSGIRDKVALTVGLMCHNTLEREAPAYLLKRAGIRTSDVSRLHFRGGEWPGGVNAVLKDGTERRLHRLTIKEAFNYLSRIYCPEGCLYCTDFCSELADISVGDPWLRGEDGRLLYEDSRSLVITRTAAGERYMEDLRNSAKIVVERIPEEIFEKNFSPASTKKKEKALIRISGKNSNGHRYPVKIMDVRKMGFSTVLRHRSGDLSDRLLQKNPLRGLYLFLAFSWCGEYFALIKEFVKRRAFTAKSRTRGRTHA